MNKSPIIYLYTDNIEQSRGLPVIQISNIDSIGRVKREYRADSVQPKFTVMMASGNYTVSLKPVPLEHDNAAFEWLEYERDLLIESITTPPSQRNEQLVSFTSGEFGGVA